jgi:glycosyltransferase involved in cell wall biosynthesis
MKPILSICIPTYNRANWLRSSLWNWLPQINQNSGLVELIVCDNKSVDHTNKILEEANTWGHFKYYQNQENIGIFNNIYRLVKDLAQGEFIWVVGDDDLPHTDALKRVMSIFKKDLNINYIYVNYSYWNPSQNIENELLKSQDLNFSKTFALDPDTKFVSHLAELVSIDINCFTPLYCSIMRKQDACEAFKLGINGDTFSSIETAIPHAVYIAKNLLDQSAWYIGKPCILASYNICWSEFLAIYQVNYLPNLFKLIEEHGGKKADLVIHRQKIMTFVPHSINTFRLSNVSIKRKIDITLQYYINFPIFWVFKKEIKFIFFAIFNQVKKLKKILK